MRVVGLRFDKITAEKFKDPEMNMELRSNFNLGDIEKDKDISEKSSKNVYRFNFTYSLEYSDVAKIEFKGAVFGEVEDEQAKKLEEDKKNVTDDDRKIILDFVLARTHVESLHLEEKLNLPFHIRSPSVSIQKQQDN